MTKERLEEKLRSHPGHVEEIEQELKRYHAHVRPKVLEKYKSFYSECADCRQDYDKAMKILEEDCSTRQWYESRLKEEEQPRA
jgi:hypothetical protein